MVRKIVRAMVAVVYPSLAQAHEWRCSAPAHIPLSALRMTRAWLRRAAHMICALILMVGLPTIAYGASGGGGSGGSGGGQYVPTLDYCTNIAGQNPICYPSLSQAEGAMRAASSYYGKLYRPSRTDVSKDYPGASPSNPVTIIYYKVDPQPVAKTYPDAYSANSFSFNTQPAPCSPASAPYTLWYSPDICADEASAVTMLYQWLIQGYSNCSNTPPVLQGAYGPVRIVGPLASNPATGIAGYSSGRDLPITANCPSNVQYSWDFQISKVTAFDCKAGFFSYYGSLGPPNQTIWDTREGLIKSP